MSTPGGRHRLEFAGHHRERVLLLQAALDTAHDQNAAGGLGLLAQLHQRCLGYGRGNEDQQLVVRAAGGLDLLEPRCDGGGVDALAQFERNGRGRARRGSARHAVHVAVARRSGLGRLGQKALTTTARRLHCRIDIRQRLRGGDGLRRKAGGDGAAGLGAAGLQDLRAALTRLLQGLCERRIGAELRRLCQCATGGEKQRREDE